jgi:hypothetical protein
MPHFVLGVLYGIIGQVISFIQLQAGIKWGWTDKFGWALMFLGLPISWSFMKSVHHFIQAFNGEIYPSRILGFAVGIVVFGVMGWVLFKEGITPKTAVCLLLSLVIILIQVLWK